jgi:hypothetical protein
MIYYAAVLAVSNDVLSLMNESHDIIASYPLRAPVDVPRWRANPCRRVEVPNNFVLPRDLRETGTF